MSASTSMTTQAGSGAMFDGIARRYDLLNRLMSLGLDQRWRRLLVDSLQLTGDERVLDLATGTADVAERLAHRLPKGHVVGLDPSEGMLAIGREKIQARGLSSRIELVSGDAQALPFADASFAAITMAFGIRNVPDRAKALREMARVLLPGGRLGILELAEPRPGLLGAAARLHVHVIVPWLGGLISGSREYRYLQESIARFPHHREFVETIRSAGFTDVRARPLTFGSVVLFEARAPGGVR
jgi:demethylmenaquinone methyltransferase/2-methoxy-6-polyprenyl-1,4-benzoquinol methylase